MTSRVAPIAAAILVVCLSPASLGAHRLDEYLQATRLSIDRDRVGVEVDLTAGVDVAQAIFASIDSDGDGRISADERGSYARQVLGSLRLSLDDRPLPLVLQQAEFPDFDQMRLGVGIIRLRASAGQPGLAAGHHELAYTNLHRPVGSVYLANVLAPGDRGIRIGGQRRDAAQHSLTLEYDVQGEGTRERASWLLAAGAMIGGLLLSRRPRHAHSWFSRNSAR